MHPMYSHLAHVPTQLDEEELGLGGAEATAELDADPDEELESDASAAFFLFNAAFRTAADCILLFAAALRNRCLRVSTGCHTETVHVDRQEIRTHRIRKLCQNMTANCQQTPRTFTKQI